jgi:hypothetical protein
MPHNHAPARRRRTKAPGQLAPQALTQAPSQAPVPAPRPGGPTPAYAPPAIVYRAALEAVAADCLTPPGKMEGLCDIGNS